MKTIRFGAIGPGGAGRNRVLGMAKDPAVEVVAANDTNPECIDKLEEGLGHKVQRFMGPSGYKKLIDKGDVDAIGVFSPHSLHYDHAKYALEAGKHVLIEKPMVCGVGNAIETAQLAAKNDLVYLIHYQRHFEAKFVTARKLIKQGMIGDVQAFYVYMAQDWSGGSWRGMPKFSGGGQINDSGSHYQDILLWMTGLLPKSAEGSHDMYYHGEKRKVPYNGSFSVELSNGAGGRIIIVGDYIKGFNDDVRIMGDKGLLTFEGANVVVDAKGKRKVVEPTVARGYPSSPGDNFVKLLTGRTKKNNVQAMFGAQVALLTDAMLLAGETSKRVSCEKLVKNAGYTMDDLTLVE